MEKNDPLDQKQIFKLLAQYRKQKEYRKELGAIDNYLASIDQRNKAKQSEWLKSHPKAAKAGRAMLRKLGDSRAGFGMEQVVARMLKRKEVVEQKLSGRKPKPKSTPAPSPTIASTPSKKSTRPKKAIPRKSTSTIPPKSTPPQKPKPIPLKPPPASLFIISLHYTVPLEKIDAVMHRHMAFLQKHFNNNTFLTAGRKVPRTGGIILARAKNKAAIERIAARDPFIKKSYATAEITEFWASRSAKGFQRLL